MEEKNVSFSSILSKEKNENNSKIFESNENISIEENEFNKKYLKRKELNVNLIYFDLNMTNEENYIYFNDFKVDVVGGFHAIEDLYILEKYLEKIKDKDIPFIAISSGTSGKDVISICKKFSFVKEVIIFCRNYNYNEHYIKENPGYVKKVLTNIEGVYEYIKTFGKDKYKDGVEKYLHEDKYIFSLDEIKMDKQIQQCPVITSYEYDRCYFLFHKIYSHFFGDINNKFEKSMFKTDNLNKIIDYLNNLNFENKKDRKFMINKFKILANFENNNKFIETD